MLATPVSLYDYCQRTNRTLFCTENENLQLEITPIKKLKKTETLALNSLRNEQTLMEKVKLLSGKVTII